MPEKPGASFMVLVCESDLEATLSNCGKVLSGFLYRPGTERSAQRTTGKLVGMVRTKKIGIIRSQVLMEPSVSMDAVQRLNVSGLLRFFVL